MVSNHLPTQTINTPITFPLVPTITVPIQQGRPPKTNDPSMTQTNLGTKGEIRMLQEIEPHVYELILPEDFDHVRVSKVRPRTVRLELESGSPSE